jgi:hypothetical protein
MGKKLRSSPFVTKFTLPRFPTNDENPWIKNTQHACLRKAGTQSRYFLFWLASLKISGIFVSTDSNLLPA